MTDAVKQQDQIVLIPLGLLVSSPLNARKTFDQKKIIELAENIEGSILINPISVRLKTKVPLGYEIVAGERRKRAFEFLKREEIPCIVRDYTDEEVEAIQLAENVHREDLSPMEECEAYHKLFKHHKTVQKVADAVGKTANYVQSRMQLSKLIPVLQGYMKNGTLPLGQALVLAKLPDEQQKELEDDYQVMRGEKGKITNIVSVERLKFVIANKVYVPLNSAAFDLKDNKLNPKMGACTECQFNTGCNTVLFSDMTDESHCTKGSCFKDKTLKHINNRVNQLKAAGEKVIMLYETDYSYSSSKQKVNGYDAVASCDFKISEKKTDGATIGIFVKQNDYKPKYFFGQEVYLSDKPKEKSESMYHTKPSVIPPEESPIEMRERRMHKRFAKEDDLDKIEVRKLIMLELFKKEELKPTVLREAAEEILEKFGINNSLVFESFGVKIAKDNRGYGFSISRFYDEKEYKQLFDKIKTKDDLLLLILRCVASANLDIVMNIHDVNITDPKHDRLIEMAAEYKIDVKKLHQPFVAKRETERKIELADLAAAKKRAKEREKKAVRQNSPQAKKEAKTKPTTKKAGKK